MKLKWKNSYIQFIVYGVFSAMAATALVLSSVGLRKVNEEGKIPSLDEYAQRLKEMTAEFGNQYFDVENMHDIGVTVDFTEKSKNSQTLTYKENGEAEESEHNIMTFDTEHYVANLKLHRSGEYALFEFSSDERYVEQEAEVNDNHDGYTITEPAEITKIHAFSGVVQVEGEEKVYVVRESTNYIEGDTESLETDKKYELFSPSSYCNFIDNALEDFIDGALYPYQAVSNVMEHKMLTSIECKKGETIFSFEMPDIDYYKFDGKKIYVAESYGATIYDKDNKITKVDAKEKYAEYEEQSITTYDYGTQSIPTLPNFDGYTKGSISSEVVDIVICMPGLYK